MRAALTTTSRDPSPSASMHADAPDEPSVLPAAEPTPAKPDDSTATSSPPHELAPHEIEAQRLAELLGETKRGVHKQLGVLTNWLGIDRIREVYQEVLAIEEAGGVYLPEYERRRTVGGLFLVTARQALTPNDQRRFHNKFGRRRRSTKAAAGGNEPTGAEGVASPPAPRPPVPIDELPEEERAAMTVSGTLEVVLKINALPAKVQTDAHGWKSFLVTCGSQQVQVKVRPKLFTKLTEASKWPLWVATISGHMGPPTRGGFELLEPNIQVFERKVKAEGGKPGAA